MQHNRRGTAPDTAQARQARHARRDERKTENGTAAGSAAFTAEVQALRTELDERTRDLQRLTAEYANYRRRMDRDRALLGEQATGAVLVELLGVLDDIDRAREHGDLVGPFGAVAEQLVAVLTKLGLTPFGEAGDPFDPSRHEAVAHSLSSEVTEPSCVQIFRRGYAYGERLLRPALVAVADPTDEEPEPEPSGADTTDQADEAEVVDGEVVDGEVVDAEAAEVVDEDEAEADTGSQPPGARRDASDSAKRSAPSGNAQDGDATKQASKPDQEPERTAKGTAKPKPPGNDSGDRGGKSDRNRPNGPGPSR